MSLLLDALKKAALEKQRREQAAGASAAPVPSVNNGTESLGQPQNSVVQEPAPFVQEVVIPSVSSIDLGPINAELLDQKPRFDKATSRPETQADDGSPFVDGTEKKESVVELSIVDLTSPLEEQSTDQSEGLVFDIGEIDDEFLRPVANEQTAVAEEKIIVEEFVRKANSPERASRVEPQSQKDVESQPIVSPQAVESEVRKSRDVEPSSKSEFAARDAKSEPYISTAAPVEVFTESSGKLALAQLLERSKSAANYSRKRMMLMYVILTITAVLIVLFYYYLLHSNADPLVNLPPAAQVTSAPAAETSPATVAENTSPSDAETVVTSIDDATVSRSIENASSANANSVIESPTTDEADLSSAPRADLRETRVSSRATRKQPDETSYSLPPDTTPRQAMIVQHQSVQEGVSEAIARGYRNYQDGDFAGAGLAYSEALKQDPYQRDALLGAAAVAVREGRQQDALGLYQQRLARDPKDEYAQAGILALSANAEDNPQLDSELAKLLTDYPDAAHLHFLQGSLFAGRQQWAAAQLSFFEAWRRDNKNPDIAFNLGVALDHLAQPKEAARFYQQALTLGSGRPVGFSIDSVQRRLLQLSGEQEGVTP